MNCSSQQPDSKLRPARDREHDRKSAALERIARILDAKQIDLGELARAICAVPDVAHDLRRLVSESGAAFETISEAAVLAGRSGIRMILCDYLHASHAPGREALLVLPDTTCDQHHSTSTETTFR